MSRGWIQTPVRVTVESISRDGAELQIWVQTPDGWHPQGPPHRLKAYEMLDIVVEQLEARAGRGRRRPFQRRRKAGEEPANG